MILTTSFPRVALGGATAAAALAVAAGAALAPSAHARRLCGGPLQTRAGIVSVEIVAGRLACRQARRVMRAYLDGAPESCEGSACYRQIRGWSCIAGRELDPQLASCYRAEHTVRAYRADL